MKEKMNKETLWKGIAITLGVALALLVMITLVYGDHLSKENDRLKIYVKNIDEAADKVIKRNIMLSSKLAMLSSKLAETRIKLIDMEDNEAELNNLKATANILEATVVELKKQLELEATLKAEELKDLRRRVNEAFDYNDIPEPDIPEKEYPDISESKFDPGFFNPGIPVTGGYLIRPSIRTYVKPETFGDGREYHIPQHIISPTQNGYFSSHTN